MNAIELLGVTLLHFLWEGFLIAAIYTIARRCVSSSEARYWLACAALFAMALSPIATWASLRPVTVANLGIVSPSPSAHSLSEFHGGAALFFVIGYERVPSSWLSWIAAVWVAGVAIFGVRLAGGWVMARRLRRKQVRSASPEWEQRFDRLRMRVQVSSPVRLLVSGLAQAPAVVGVLRPVVLVPAGALARLVTEQMEALLLHELAHIRRYDHLVNAAQSIIETLLFYHPAVWWVSGHMRLERELCCDDTVSRSPVMRRAMLGPLPK